MITPVALEQGERYPMTITYLKGGSAALWLKHIDLKGKGDLATLNQEGKYSWFADEEGKWTVRNDVTYWETRVSKEEGGSGGPLTTTSNGKFIGPEVPFGYVMGTYHDEPVLLIESSMGNRALSFDFRPPSSGKTEEEKGNKYCGFEYNAMIEGVHRTLKSIDKVVPRLQRAGLRDFRLRLVPGAQGQGRAQEGIREAPGQLDQGCAEGIQDAQDAGGRRHGGIRRDGYGPRALHDLGGPDGGWRSQAAS